MTGKGAPRGNDYAAKPEKGRSISLYLSGDDQALLRLVLQQRGEDSSDAACVKLAKMAAKAGINRLLIDKQDEVVYWAKKETKMDTVDMDLQAREHLGTVLHTLGVSSPLVIWTGEGRAYLDGGTQEEYAKVAGHFNVPFDPEDTSNVNDRLYTAYEDLLSVD